MCKGYPAGTKFAGCTSRIVSAGLAPKPISASKKYGYCFWKLSVAALVPHTNITQQHERSIVRHRERGLYLRRLWNGEHTKAGRRDPLSRLRLQNTLQEANQQSGAV